MFGKRGNEGFGKSGTVTPVAPASLPAASAVIERPVAAAPVLADPVRESGSTPVRAQPSPPPVRKKAARTEDYYDTKSQVFSALIDTIDLSQLAKLDTESAREEIRDIVNDIITIKNFAMSISEQEELLEDICNDVLGYGPLEPLLARDDIADIMVNGAARPSSKLAARTSDEVRFRDNAQLMNDLPAHRVPGRPPRRRIEPDLRRPPARRLRVNVIAPPLAIDGTALTIRKFKKDKLKLDQLVKFGAITPEGAVLLQIIGRVRCNVVISGGTGSGKTTLLNCLTGFIDLDRARHHLRGYGRTAAAAAACRPPRNPSAQPRGRRRDHHARSGQELPAYASRAHHRRRSPRTRGFDLLQAMNTGHDGSMGTIHANTPRECLSRMESMIAMGGYSLPAKTIAR